MGASEWFVIIEGLVLAGFLTWFFFGPKQARRAALGDGVQEVHVTVKGGYTPDLIRVRQGVPLRLIFDRQEAGDCTSRVVFSDFEPRSRFRRSEPQPSSSPLIEPDGSTSRGDEHDDPRRVDRRTNRRSLPLAAAAIAGSSPSVVGNASRLRRWHHPCHRLDVVMPSGDPVVETDTHDVDGDATALVTDPVCGMRIDPSQASATVTRDGDTYYFCSNSCHGQFVAGYAAEPPSTTTARTTERTHGGYRPPGTTVRAISDATATLG